MKKIIAIICTGIALASLTGCSALLKGNNNSNDNNAGNNNTTNNSSTISSSNSTNTNNSTNTSDSVSSETGNSNDVNSDDSSLKAYEKVANNFVKALCNGDYKQVISLLNVSSTEFISEEDIEWIIPRTGLADIIEASTELTIETTKADVPNYEVSVENSGGKAIVNVVLTDSNDYKVNWSDAIVTNWEIRTAKGLTLTYGDVELSSKLTPVVNEGYNSVSYVVPAIVARNRTLTSENSVGDKFTCEAVPGGSAFVVTNQISGERLNEMNNALIDVANAVFQLKISGASNGEFEKHISSKSSPAFADTLKNSISGSQITFSKIALKKDGIVMVGPNEFSITSQITYDKSYGAFGIYDYDNDFNIYFSMEDGVAKISDATSADKLQRAFKCN